MKAIAMKFNRASFLRKIHSAKIPYSWSGMSFSSREKVFIFLVPTIFFFAFISFSSYISCKFTVVCVFVKDVHANSIIYINLYGAIHGFFVCASFMYLADLFHWRPFLHI